MTQSPNVFNQHMARWQTEQQTPWAKLKYAVVRANLQKHAPPDYYTILDVGGGNGHDSLPFAQMGHHVTILDSSQEMLQDAARTVQLHGLEQRVQLYFGDVLDLPSLVTSRSFDLVLCHNVIQYIPDLTDLLAMLSTATKSGGILSLLSVNRYSIVYKAAFMYHDLAHAFSSIGSHSEQAVLFDTPLIEYSSEEVSAAIQMHSYHIQQHYGIRCICDYWGTNDLKLQAETMQHLEQLELALTDQHPYKHLARYFQLIARKE